MEQKITKLEKTEKLYNNFLSKINRLCDEVDVELKQINQNTTKIG